MKADLRQSRTLLQYPGSPLATRWSHSSERSSYPHHHIGLSMFYGRGRHSRSEGNIHLVSRNVRQTRPSEVFEQMLEQTHACYLLHQKRQW